ncbi:hypothetical protein PQE68_gp172 [Bacillus phage vB_BanS_Sophrita]|uniref:Lipoprotein n=1 Tax=Bacillus phage vB_BanS_Sophrita TaxID=2894790 RepID=A0AAE8YVJ8_9CAUD|nr:hypothetical protein PQE68_gp172 [Bacillus phage vB_BanS_Sophrita]UGO50763.1 hypothetical protein SOPHRITA_172 [Bacillus phage vB_BanS_Sophrita]
MKNTKKGLLVLLLAGVMTTMVACAEVPQGVDEKFHSKSYEMFMEIDEDTMEMELSDRDDVANFQVLQATANNDLERAFVKGMEDMLKLQERVINQDGNAMTEYMKARELAMESMNFDDDGDGDSFPVDQFGFSEDN